jgi:hypothetical protein
LPAEMLWIGTVAQPDFVAFLALAVRAIQV